MADIANIIFAKNAYKHTRITEIYKLLRNCFSHPFLSMCSLNFALFYAVKTKRIKHLRSNSETRKTILNTF